MIAVVARRVVSQGEIVDLGLVVLVFNVQCTTALCKCLVWKIQI